MNDYENFIKNSSVCSFTQSEKWANVKDNWICERITVKDNNSNIIGAMQIMIKKIPFFNVSFMYSPRGMICDYHSKEVIAMIMEKVNDIQKRYNGFMLKIDPMINIKDTISIDNLIDYGFKYKINQSNNDTVQCISNYILDISNKSENEVFNSFHKKWRYNIRLSERKGVKCSHYGIEKLDDFYNLMIETTKRDKFNIRSKEYFAKIINCMGENCRLYMCYYNNIALSGAITINYGGRVSYLYGASTEKYRNLMPNYLMQWNMIKWAIETNCKIYDFMGIPFYDDETHPNYGVYRFKKGFNGEIINYAGEFNYIYYPVRKKIISKLFELTSHKKL